MCQEREKKIEEDMQRAVQFKKERDAALVQEQVSRTLLYVLACIFEPFSFGLRSVIDVMRYYDPVWVIICELLYLHFTDTTYIGSLSAISHVCTIKISLSWTPS